MSLVRVLKAHRAYVAIAVATVALSVGANLVVFSFINALWLRPLAVFDADRVVVVGLDSDIPDSSRYSELGLDRLRQNASFEAVAGQTVTSGPFAGLRPRVSIVGINRRLEAVGVTPQFFAVLGVRLTGREFDPGEGEGPGPVPVVISDELWRSAWQSRPDVLGLVVPAAPVDLQVVGVAPRNFRGARIGERVDLWLAHRALTRLAGYQADQVRWAIAPLATFARLRPGASVDSARAELQQTPRSRGPGLTPWVPDVMPLRAVFGAADLPMVRVRGGDVMTMTAITAAFVLIGGCATLMALALVHYEQRRRELAVRAALGGTRARLIGELASELAALAVVGTLGALCVAQWTIALLPHFGLPGGVDLGRLDLSIDWRVGLAGLASCLIAMGLGGILPVARLTRADMALSLISPSSTTSRSSLRLRKAILTMHVAATTVVLCAAALFVQSVTQALAIGPGFDDARVLFATVVTRANGLPDGAALQERKARDVAAALAVWDQIAATAGVEVVAAGPSPLGIENEYRLSQRQTVEADGVKDDAAVLGWLAVGEGYLEALGIPLLAGRAGLSRDVVVTPALARDLWGDDWPIGKQFTFSMTGTHTVAGIADVAFGSVRLGRPPAALSFTGVTVPSMINNTGELALAIRTQDPDALKAPLEQLLTRSFPDAPVISLTTGREQVTTDLGRERMSAWMFSAFGLVALFLAVESIFGLVAYLIASRRREFGVRIALGATRADVAKRALWASLEPTLYGAAFGIMTAVPLAHVVRSYLYGVSSTEPLTYAAVFVTLVACATLAGAAAASRVRHVSPIDSLRAE